MYFKYIYQFFILYIFINIILKKKCFNKNDNKIILIAFVSSLSFYILDKINTKEDKEDFLSKLDKNITLTY